MTFRSSHGDGSRIAVAVQGDRLHARRAADRRRSSSAAASAGGTSSRSTRRVTPLPAINFTVNDGETVESLSFRLKEQRADRERRRVPLVRRAPRRARADARLLPAPPPRPHGQPDGGAPDAAGRDVHERHVPRGLHARRGWRRGSPSKSPRFLVSDFIKAADERRDPFRLPRPAGGDRRRSKGCSSPTRIRCRTASRSSR